MKRPLLLALALACHAWVAHADWLQPDPSYREAVIALRFAVRDTIGHSDDPARLDSLGTALLRLGQFREAEAVFRRVLALDPGARLAAAGLGKIALFEDRLDEAVQWLTKASGARVMPGPNRRGEVGSGLDTEAARDLIAARIRRDEYHEITPMDLGVADEPGREPLLDSLAARPPYRIGAGWSEVFVPWARAYPVPLVRVKLNGQSVLMAIDTGAADLLIDESAARRCKVRALPAQRLEFWSGSRFAVRNAIVDRLELGGIRIERLPAGTLPLRKWSIEVNPHSEQVAGIIGLGLLRRFTPTLDYEKLRLELRPLENAAIVHSPDAQRVPFEIWGTSELTVRGSIAGGRRMAMVVQTGVPGCGVGAPPEVFEEVGIKAGAVSRVVSGAGSWLHGRPWAHVTVPTVALGGIVADRVPGWSGALDSSELWRHGVRRDALLSHDFFRGRRVTIDWKARELVFEQH